MEAMTKTVYKWYWVWEFEQEEEWLNLMAQSGWALEKVGFAVYRFRAAEPGSCQIALEMREPDDAYIEFMGEMGNEYVGRMAAWIYWRHKAEAGPFEIFSDLESKIRHMDKIASVLKIVGLANLCIGLAISLNPILPIGWINLVCAALVMYCLGRIQGKKEGLIQSRRFYE